jgi:hypothetical protein
MSLKLKITIRNVSELKKKRTIVEHKIAIIKIYQNSKTKLFFSKKKKFKCFSKSAAVAYNLIAKTILAIR